MEKALKKSYKEVAQILDILGDKYKKQIPDKIKQLFYDSQNNDIVLDINDYKNLENIKVSRNALIIISILNLKYWEKDENKKQLLKQIYDNNEKEYQEKINAYQEKDWLKTKKINNIQSAIETQTETELGLIVRNKNSLFEKIKQFFQNIFHRKREY